MSLRKRESLKCHQFVGLVPAPKLRYSTLAKLKAWQTLYTCPEMEEK